MRLVLTSLILLLGIAACKPAETPPEPEKKSEAREKAVVANNEVKMDAFFASSFKQFDRQSHPLDQYKGKIVVAYFWATWCKSCLKEVPQLMALQNQYKDKNVQFIGIAVDNTDKVEKFVKDNRIPYPVLIGSDDALELSKKLGNLVLGLPFLVVIDKNGNLAGKLLGELPAGKLEALLAAATA